MKASDFLEQFQSAASVVGLHQPVVVKSEDGYQEDATGVDFSHGRVVVTCGRITSPEQADDSDSASELEDLKDECLSVERDMNDLIRRIRKGGMEIDEIIEGIEGAMFHLPVNT